MDDLEASERRMATIVDVARQLAAEGDVDASTRALCAAAREVTVARWGGDRDHLRGLPAELGRVG